MSQRIGQRALEEAVGIAGNRLAQRQPVIRGFQVGVESCDLGVPVADRTCDGGLFAFNLPREPVEEVVDVGEDFDGGAAGGGGAGGGEIRGGGGDCF
jgi:hypothetical protein